VGFVAATAIFLHVPGLHMVQLLVVIGLGPQPRETTTNGGAKRNLQEEQPLALTLARSVKQLDQEEHKERKVAHA